MIAKRRTKAVHLFVCLAEAVLISLALIYLAEYFALPIFWEAGGGAV
jgi:hypothetical protein